MSVNAACINFRPAPAEIPAADAGRAPTAAWSVDGGRGATPPMIAHEGRVYLAGGDRQVRALDVETGREIWHRRLAGPILGGVLLHDTLLFVATGRPEGKVHALHAQTGRTVWRTGVGDIAAPLAVAGGAVAGINRRGELLALEVAGGDVRWRRRIGPSRLAPLASGDAFLAATGDSILRIEAGEGRTVARRALAVPAIDWREAGGMLVMTATDSTLTGVRPETFAVAWRAPLDGPVLGTVGIRGDTAWVVTRKGTLYEVDLAGSGNARALAHLATPITTGVTPIADLLLVGGADGILRGITRAGQAAWRVNLTWNITVDPVQVPGGFLAAGGDGDLHRFSE